MKVKSHFLILLLFSGILSLTSCSSDDDSVAPDEDELDTDEKYIIAASDSENAYLMPVSDISEGEISPKGDNSTQIIGTPSWYFYKNISAFSFIYRKGDPGTTQSFYLNENGEIDSQSEVDLSVSAQAKGVIGDQIYLQFSSRNYEEPISTFYKIDGESQDVSQPIVIDTDDWVDNGEYAYITEITEYKDHVLAGFRTIKAGEDGGDSQFNSDYNDHTYLAIFNKDLEMIRVLEDTGRTGMISGQTRATGETGIEPVENGDIYVFSSALDAEDVPSGILKINAGDVNSIDFDDDYFFNISEASGGHKIHRTYYVGNNNFVVQMFTEPNTASGSPDDTANKFAVVNVEDQSFDWVDDMPEPNSILNIGAPYVDKDNGQVVFPIETDGYPTLYIIDGKSASATKGLEVKTEGVNAVGKLSKH